jgi:16S rRNA (uracil1498-N3)-methyltransferase
MHRFYVDPRESGNDLLELNEREAHHAANVLRLRKGDPVVALDGQGSELACNVLNVGKRGVTLQVHQRNKVPPLPYQLTLVQAIPKGKTMETIVQKAAELGAWKVVPIITERTVTQLDEDRSESKVEKWKWIAIDAIKQCGSTWLPKIAEPIRVTTYLGSKEPSEMTLIASLQSGSKHPRLHFRDFEREHGRRPKTISVWVGPEGDFTPGEVNSIMSAGALPVTLGPLVLRSDTAALYCLSMVNYEMQSPRE